MRTAAKLFLIAALFAATASAAAASQLAFAKYADHCPVPVNATNTKIKRGLCASEATADSTIAKLSKMFPFLNKTLTKIQTTTDKSFDKAFAALDKLPTPSNITKSLATAKGSDGTTTLLAKS
jgi:hypothetical protein